MWWKLLLLPVFLYAAVCAALWFYQGSLLFPAQAAGGARPLPERGERLVLDTADGERLQGLRIRPAAAPAPEAPLILGFGGNAWNADDVAATLAELFPRHEVVVFHYRGYAPGSGRPSGAALLADAPLVHDEIVRRFRPAGIVAVGFSIGSGVAARLARERPLAGLVLVTPFDSLAAVAADHYPWLPVRLLFRHEMPAAGDLAAGRVRTAIVAAGGDTLILPARTEALRRRVPNLAYDRTIAGAGHNDIYQRAEFARAMREAFARVSASD